METGVKTLKIALAQLNPTLGAIAANADLLRAVRASASEADVVLASELFLTGYPPEDLVLKRAFLARVQSEVDQLVKDTADGGPALVFGAPMLENGQLYNSVVVADGGQMAVRHKHHLPNYAVFDEKRLFAAGPLPKAVELRGVRVGLPICEDIWFEDVCAQLKADGAALLLSPNGSPFERGKQAQRMAHAAARAQQTGLPLVYVNQYGGQDELVFDGASFAVNADGALAEQRPAWAVDTQVLTLHETADGWKIEPSGARPKPQDELGDIYAAAVLGLRDYVEKNRFPGVLLGLSGGVDSAICAAMAVDALGPERVHCLMLPSRYTSAESLTDAAACAKQLGIRLDDVSIAGPVDSVESALSELFKGTQADTTEENIQSRLRGTLLMAVSNKFGAMVVTTGNKSEVSVGYATLYGDMNGGYNPIKDIYKTEVFELCRWRNENLPAGALGPAGEVIPPTIIDKPPSAELRPDQKDEDSLPPYAQLDDILFALVEDELSFDEIVARGHGAETVQRIEHLLYISEYKRRQAAPGAKIGNRNFGRDRRYPITNGFRDAR
ncbi:MAG: NAD+ synthase [Rhodobiaceae bacterium]|nr:NAD+ synthase [Rhodobiaceae bacterium]MBT5517718.1 NAD+ synthase [Rhodobiaceae bacterium]MBT7280662.1 NAD+ synthase [Rhodobiaceae bacterium]